MKEIVPDTVLRDYFVEKAINYDEFISFRKAFSYQYGTILAVNYVLNNELNLANYIVNLKNGFISIMDQRLNASPAVVSAFCVRISRNFNKLFGKTYINAGIVPAFVATIDALNNKKYFTF
jgi:hypothetical protein